MRKINKSKIFKIAYHATQIIYITPILVNKLIMRERTVSPVCRVRIHIHVHIQMHKNTQTCKKL